METKEIIRRDLYRYMGSCSAMSFLGALKQPGFLYTYLFRRTKNATSTQFFYKLLLRRYRILYGIQISYKTKIGYGLYIGHFGNIVVNENTCIGNNCNIAQGVTIGQVNRGQKKGCPTIGDNVWIGANAVIVGKISIGSNVLIAPNSYVNFDVPANSLVVAGKIIYKEDPTESYIQNVLPI